MVPARRRAPKRRHSGKRAQTRPAAASAGAAGAPEMALPLKRVLKPLCIPRPCPLHDSVSIVSNCVGRRAAGVEAAGGGIVQHMDRARLHVLLVEDDAKLARLTRDYLEQHELVVTSVADGNSAVREGIRSDIDVVVLDLMLPGRDGFEVCRQIRSKSHVPIIAVTARVEVADRVLGLELGADDYMTKPFSARELLARIQAVARRAQGRAGPESQELRV